MLKPLNTNRNVSASFLAQEQKNINQLNKVLKGVELSPEEERILLWLCGWETSTVKSICSVLERVKGK